MLFVIVSKSGNVVGKEVYSGDDAKNTAFLLAKRSSDASVTYDIVDKETFEGASVVAVVSKDQADWQIEKLKGAIAALAFLAKKLGLE